MWCSLIVVSLVGLALLTSAQYDGARCRTPNNEAAECKSIYFCETLYSVVTSKNEQQKRFLKKSQCGYDDDGPLVCCGTHNNYRTTHINRVTTWEPETVGNRDSSNTLLPDRSNCGIQDTNRIIGGEATALDEFPWMALLQYRTKANALTYACGGTLISSKYVLTAAHCVTGRILTAVGPLVNVRLGEYNTDTAEDCVGQYGFNFCNDAPIDAGVDRTIPHSQYTEADISRYHDIALVRLKRSVPTTQFIKPICLPTSLDKSNVGTKLMVAGWGKADNGKSSSVKLKVGVPVVDEVQCVQQFKAARVNLRRTQLCAGGERDKDSCKGDSGGPLMATYVNNTAQWYIEGVVSFGAACGTEGWPGIYTRVSEYVGWIKQNIRP